MAPLYFIYAKGILPMKDERIIEMTIYEKNYLSESDLRADSENTL